MVGTDKVNNKEMVMRLMRMKITMKMRIRKTKMNMITTRGKKHVEKKGKRECPEDASQESGVTK